MTKKEQVRLHLLRGNAITSWEAISLYRATRLSAIIYELREEGMNIGNAQKEMQLPYAYYLLKESDAP